MHRKRNLTATSLSPPCVCQSVRPLLAPKSQPLSLSHLKIGENGWCKYELVLRKITDHRGPRRPAAAGPVLRGCCRTVRPTIRSYFSLQTLYTYPENFRAYKALIAAQYSGAKVTVAADFVFGETNKSEAFLQKFPTGKVSTNCPVRPPKPPHLSCITGFLLLLCLTLDRSQAHTHTNTLSFQVMCALLTSTHFCRRILFGAYPPQNRFAVSESNLCRRV